MTKAEKLKESLKSGDFGGDGIDAMIIYAYYAGKEKATKTVSDNYNKLLSEQKRRAKDCRYHHMAMNVQGNVNYIYHEDYSQDVIKTFGGDEIYLQENNLKKEN